MSSSLPAQQSASFSTADPGVSSFTFDGELTGSATQNPANFYDAITTTNMQGMNPSTGVALTAYEDAINLMANADEYDINLMLLPGLNIENDSDLINKAIDVCEGRADAFLIADPVNYASDVTTVVGKADGIDTNYAAVYWPWVQIQDSRANGALRWVPP